MEPLEPADIEMLRGLEDAEKPDSRFELQCRRVHLTFPCHPPSGEVEWLLDRVAARLARSV